MARTNTAKKTETEGTVPQAALAVLSGGGEIDLLDGMEFETDGLEEMDASDFRISTLAFNFSGTDENDDPIPANRFFDTVTEDVKPTARLALLTIHKSNKWSEFIDGQGSVTRCQSWDRVTGTKDDGQERPCSGCPDKAWTQNPETSKRTRRCSDVQNLVGLDLDDGQPKVLRCKRTSEKPLKAYINKHFLGKRIVQGKRKNYPLFAFETTLGLDMVKGKSGSYAVPTFTCGAQFGVADLARLNDEAKAAREYMDDVRKAVEASPEDGDAGASTGTVIDSAAFTDNDAGDGTAPAERF